MKESKEERMEEEKEETKEEDRTTVRMIVSRGEDPVPSPLHANWGTQTLPSRRLFGVVLRRSYSMSNEGFNFCEWMNRIERYNIQRYQRAVIKRAPRCWTDG